MRRCIEEDPAICGLEEGLRAWVPYLPKTGLTLSLDRTKCGLSWCLARDDVGGLIVETLHKQLMYSTTVQDKCK